MADRTPPRRDRTAQVPPAGPGSPWPAADPWATQSGPSWPDPGPSWPDELENARTLKDQPQSRSPFQRGVAQVRPTPGRRPDDTYTGNPDFTAVGRPVAQPRPPLGFQLRQLRRGGEWTTIGLLFAFVCWGIWVVSNRSGELAGPVLLFILVLLVAGGVFALARLLGMVVIERALHRTRRSAWGSHLVTGLFLAAAGVAYLQQTQWVVDAWNWVNEAL